MEVTKLASETVTAIPDAFKELYAACNWAAVGVVVNRAEFARIHVCIVVVNPVLSSSLTYVWSAVAIAV
jgi:hypothetical protein